jgi:hypothetical protein
MRWQPCWQHNQQEYKEETETMDDVLHGDALSGTWRLPVGPEAAERKYVYCRAE